MTDPLNPTAAATDASGFAQDGGLNTTDTADWTNEKSPLRWPMIVLFGLPMVILAAGLTLMVISYNLAHKPAAPKTEVAAVSAPLSEKDAQIQQLQAQIASLQSHATVPGESAPVTPTYTDPTALSQLSARLDRLEANQRALIQAASSAYAARALQTAASGPAPFLSELAVVEPTLDDPSQFAALRPFAEKGVPSAAALAVEFPQVARKANIAAKAANANDSLLSRAKHIMDTLVSIRRVDGEAQGAQATILSAETRVNQGDLKGAVAYLSTLKPEVQMMIKPWLDQARARVLVDDTTRRISETALNRLSQMNAGQANTGGAL